MYQEEKNILAERITELRKNNNYTQEDISVYLNCNRATVANYESGKRQPDYNTLIKLAKKYDVSTDYLLGVTDTATTDENLKFICDYTGLSENFLDFLLFEKEIFNDCIKGVPTTIFVLNEIFSLDKTSNDFALLCDCIYNYKKTFSNTVKEGNDVLKKEFVSHDDVLIMNSLQDKVDLAKFRCTQKFEKLLSNCFINEEKELTKIQISYSDKLYKQAEDKKDEILLNIFDKIREADDFGRGVYARLFQQDLSKDGES